jgi:hypothetical protein
VIGVDCRPRLIQILALSARPGEGDLFLYSSGNYCKYFYAWDFECIAVFVIHGKTYRDDNVLSRASQEINCSSAKIDSDHVSKRTQRIRLKPSRLVKLYQV